MTKKKSDKGAGSKGIVHFGRPSKCTPETREKVCQAIMIGHSVGPACTHAGISRRIHREWMRRGRAELAARITFSRLLEKEAAFENERKDPAKIKVNWEAREARDIARADKAGGEQRFIDYTEAVERTIAQAELTVAGMLMKSAKGGEILERTTIRRPDGTEITTEKRSKPSPRAAMFFLERRYPERYGRQIRIEATGADGDPLIPGGATPASRDMLHGVPVFELLKFDPSAWEHEQALRKIVERYLEHKSQVQAGTVIDVAPGVLIEAELDG